MRAGRFTGYTLGGFQKDVTSGVVVGIVALPLAMAFAIASGVRPEYGIYSTIIAGFLISFFGGSRYQIGGPTGAFVPILFGIVMQYGYENLLVAGFLAGILLVIMGLLKIGSFIHYIPRPVTIGFTAGIAVLIFVGQIAPFLGLQNLKPQEEFILKFKEILVNLGSINFYALLTSAICFGMIFISLRFLPKIPWALLGLVLSTIVPTLFFSTEVATIGSTFGSIPTHFPSFQLPDLSWTKILELLIPACIIAMLGGVESLLSALVADGMTNHRHHSNRELIGQGIANMVTPLFGGIPATGAIARTATNIKSGAVSPLSGMIHSLFVLVVLVSLFSYASHIPLASMAPILMVVAWNMSERKEFLHVLRSKTEDSWVLLSTFLLTVIFDLVVGVLTGLALSFLLFTIRMSKEFRVRKLHLKSPHHEQNQQNLVSYSGSNVQVCLLNGPIFFGTAKQLHQLLKTQENGILVLCMDKVPYMDTTGEQIFSHLFSHIHKKGNKLIITGIQQQPKEVIQKICHLNKINENEFFSTGMQKELDSHIDLNHLWKCAQKSH
ncbi:SulP family inorganic anion transporter [Baia soyae]|uniref:SulP family sulfate permease n=1 Tax=Baia soyae TaxID=1544746 RepID=A0A4R2REI7_9BACL|nr:SulP family inorganic anion transporter [Baia soyae]TCP60437.1 SulP family sulfate permease [Baia soyae]